MSLISSLYIGQNGLSTTSTELGVIGDNVANASTIGFKAGRASFADLMGEGVVGGTGQLGLGSRLQAVQKILTQGALSTTGVSTDLAISGNGMFAVRTSEGLAYTRNGQFQMNEDGFIVDLQGNRVQGFPADGSGTINGAMGDLQPGNATAPPQATTSVTVRANLDADEEVGLPFDPADPEGTSNFSTSTQLFDSLGRPVDATIYYTKTGDGQWEYHTMVDGGTQEGGVAGTPVEVAGGLLTFDTEGNLDTATETLNNFLPVGATQPQPLTFDFGQNSTNGQGITQNGNVSANTFVSQDGFAAGDLGSISIGTDGTITGTFTNGQSRALGQVGLADFPAPDQLERIGNNLFRPTNLSGEANVGAAGTGGRGKLFSGALEQANVDVATELVRMIVVQRNFQANSKTVSTADQMLSELIQLKR